MKTRKRPEIIEVEEVDANGRPKVVRVYDVLTNSQSRMEWVNGYRPSAGAIHAYDPFDALKRD